ncbi:hypothetical protein [Streptomyces sp. NPDC048639]|uniref:hypothetical protein n=1 Tax=Streptomyces sp. NPDC048639 TaxID=3365581 RepID=UPI00371BA76D
MGLDGLKANATTLKSEGRQFTDIGKDFDGAVRRLMDNLHALNAGPPSKQSAKDAPPPPPQPGVVDQFVTGLTTLDSKSGAPPWGDDEIGENFGVAYEGLRDGMYESMGHLAAKLQEIGKALEGMAKNHEANEDFNESLMKQHVANSQGNSKAIWSMKSPHH